MATHFFEMNTNQGSKYIRLVRISDGVITNLLPHASLADGWPELTPGLNLFVVSADDFGQTWSLTYRVRLGGL